MWDMGQQQMHRKVQAFPGPVMDTGHAHRVRSTMVQAELYYKMVITLIFHQDRTIICNRILVNTNQLPGNVMVLSD